MTVIDGATNSTGSVSVGLDPVFVAVNAVTNKIYVANNLSADVTVIDGTNNSTLSVPAGNGPLSIAVNPVTNRIYVLKGASNNVTVIDGATNATATVNAGTYPQAVAVNLVTNKIYVANQNSGNVTVIDGANNSTTTVSAGNTPVSVAVNPVTNKIYVANSGSGNVTVIDGGTNATAAVTAGVNPSSIAVNPVTNKIYVSNRGSGSVSVIDGSTNSTTTISAGTQPVSVVVNPVTNKIYVINFGSSSVTVLDGATNSSSSVNVGTDPDAAVVNPATNTIYVANDLSNNVTVLTEQQVQTIPLTTTITALPGNLTVSSTPSFTFSAQSTFSPNPTTPANVFFQVDSWQGPWITAAGSGSSYSGTTPALQPGFHILYAYADDGQEASPEQSGSPLTGDIAAYGFLVNPFPSPVTVFSPAQGATGVSTTPTLTWGAAALAASYDVYFGTSPIPPFVANTSGLSYSPATLLPGTTYYWFLVSKNAAGSTGSDIWSFTTAYPPFFTGEAALTGGVFYLQFPSGNLFGYYNFQFFPIVYHYDLGFEYFVDTNNGQAGAYLYDFSSGHWWYSSPSLFPYLYDFTLNSWLYYFPDTKNPGHYTTNPRYFSNLTTGKIISM